ncbi:hypothetical protein [Streptococcus agalactiae]
MFTKFFEGLLTYHFLQNAFITATIVLLKNETRKCSSLIFDRII